MLSVSLESNQPGLSQDSPPRSAVTDEPAAVYDVVSKEKSNTWVNGGEDECKLGVGSSMRSRRQEVTSLRGFCFMLPQKRVPVVP